MRLGLRIFLGYFLVVGLAGFFVMRVFVNEVKPGVRQAMEATLVDTASALAALAAPELRGGELRHGRFAQAIDTLAGQDLQARISDVAKKQFDYRIYVTDTRGIVIYDSIGRDVGADFSRWNDVHLTLRGHYGARSTRDDPSDDSSSVMYVAAPIVFEQKLIGVLTVAKANRHMEPFIAASQAAILRQGALLLGLSFVIGIAVTWWLSSSVNRLGSYAKAVAAGERVALPALGGELNDLGKSLETMRAKLDGKQYVEQYVQTLAHEMKSPLAAIRGAVEILGEHPPEVEQQRFIGNIDQQSARMAGMIDKMLALAAVEYRQVLEKPEPVDIFSVLAEIKDAFTPRMRAKNVRLLLTTPPELSRIVIVGDRFLLAQAIINLLENALAFAPLDSAITAELIRDNSFYCLRISDTGPGFPEFARERLFERFYSLPRPDGSRSSGLGLGFVREVASLHGGSIRLENARNGGAFAELRLPI